MPPKRDRTSEVNTADEPRTDPDQARGPAPPDPAPDAAAPQAPPPKPDNFVDPAWRGKKYLTPEAFCRRIYDYFGYRPGKSTMHRWLRDGRIYAIRVGKLWFIPESVWEEFLKCCKQGDRF